MARVREKVSNVALALDKLQGLAETLISAQTNRQVQLGREKESRMIEAYNYMSSQENAQILQLETALDSIEQNLLDRGVELKSVDDINRTANSELLLTAANEGAMELVLARLADSRDYKDKLDTRRREAQKVLRHIDLFDDAISTVDPAFAGEEHLIEAVDVAKAAKDFAKGKEKYGPEIEQRLKALQTEGALRGLQEDYYARLAKEAQDKITAASAGQTDAKIKIETLEPVKKEAQEAVVAMTQQPVGNMIEQYGVIISRQAEIDADENMNNADKAKKEEEILLEERRLGSILFPWAYSQEQAVILAKGMQTSLTKVARNGDYFDLINYFRQGNAQYKTMVNQGNPLADTYRSDIQSMFGIDIASDSWVSQLIELNEVSGRVDIEQAMESLKIGRALLPPVESDGGKSDLDLFMEGRLE